MQNVNEAEQNKNDAENDKVVPDSTKDAKSDENNATVAKVDTMKVIPLKENNQAPADTPAEGKVVDNSTAPAQKQELRTKPTANKKKSNFGGLRKGFLL